MKNSKYVFCSERLGFRNWSTEDIPAMAAINQDEAVMEYFPSLQTLEQTTGFVQRMQDHFAQYGFTYFAVDRLDREEWIGFIGMHHQDYESPYTPCVDIGWRLQRAAWGQGFATEGAKACLDFAFQELQLPEIYSVASTINEKSIRVMQKAGLELAGNFTHPKLLDTPHLQECVAYLIRKEKHLLGTI